jgi:uncharacterized OsmC-like protein
MVKKSADTLLRFSDPLGFRVRSGSRRSPVVVGTGSDLFKVEARTLAGQQKEAILTEGATGSVWRLASDEGPAMKGDDIAPFPLGFLIAGVAADLYNRIRAAAARRGATMGEVEIAMSHLFGSAGSFIRSTATASSEAAELRIELKCRIDAATAKSLVAEAMAASPAIAFLRLPMKENTFALYINGRRRTVVMRPNSVAADVTDPFLTYRSAPRPETPDGRADLIEKPGIVETGEAREVPLTSPEKRLFMITGTGCSRAVGEFLTETWIARPGMNHFRILSDESAADTAPSGLGLLSVGIASCYLTQLHRYVEAQKLSVHSARLVQFTPFTGGANARAGAIDTHLFLNGDAPEALHLNLLTIAAHTCFMHAAAAGSVEPSISLTLNGKSLT